MIAERLRGAMTWTPRKIWTTFAVIAVVAGTAWWELLHVPAVARQQVWEGELVSKEEARDWWRGIRRAWEPKRRFYTFYWHIRTPSGETIRVDVPQRLYQRAEPGDPIQKHPGERWPTIATAAESQRQEAIDQVF